MKKFLLLSFAALVMAACGDSDWMGDGDVYYTPKELNLSKSSLNELIVGETRQLYASFDPAETTDGEVVWLTSDETVATVSESGAVRATGLGEAVITVQSVAYPEIEASCTVSVTVESGIRVYDYLLNEPVDDLVTFVRNSTGNRAYYFEVFVHDTFDKSVTVQSTNPNVVAVEMGEVNGQTGFTLMPGQELGNATVILQSTRNDDVRTEIPVSLKTIKVAGVALSLNSDGSNAAKDLVGSLTVSHTKTMRVVFETDDAEIKIPENAVVTIESSNTAVATVDAVGTQDPATQHVFFNVYMVDEPANAPDGVATITVKTDDGGYEATFTVTAQCPAVEQIVLSQDVSDPILAGKSMQLTYTTVPADAYVQTVTWTSADENVATVDANGVVTIKPDFVFDPENYTATEILITATSNDVGAAAASCKLRPYQYVPATGVMVTDQWGNRMRGTSSTNTSISSTTNYATMVYCSGGGKAKTNQFSDTQSWAVASPAVEGVDKVGSVAVYLTATPYPYEYPTIADPDQPFYCGCLSTSRFAIAGAGYEAGNQSEGWTAIKADNGKIKCFLGHTCKFWTGHGNTTKDAPYVRIWRYTEGQANDKNYDKTNDLLFRFLINTSKGSGDSSLGIPSLQNADGTARVFDFHNVNGIAQPFNDPCPVPWTGPMPRPVGYYLLDDNGAPDQFKSWGDIPVPTKLNEIR